jgi:endogenous inhibitor of DNA gyrase (YacG/DUF329 family)
MKANLLCNYCGVLFSVFPSRAQGRKYCTLACKRKADAAFLQKFTKAQDTRITIKCDHCGKDVKRRQRYIEQYASQYCSIRCKALAQEKHIKCSCYTCGKEFEIHPSDLRKSPKAGTFCSKNCRGVLQTKTQKGSNNPFWKGGVSSLNKLIRNGKSMMNWRISVFKRDDYTCQVCGIRGGLLHAHHIVPFKEDKQNFDVNNGMTVHSRCHYEQIHGYNRAG